MSKTASVILEEQSAAFVQRQVAQGRYQSESEVVQAGLKLLEEREAKLEPLRQALIEGEESGIAEDFDFEEFIARKRAGDRSAR
jgi:antitoxin ParD1/3/4